MKNRTFLYSLSALLWLGIAFSLFYFYQNSEEQEVETIIQSAEKIDNLHQEFSDLEYTWWERNKLASFVSINNRDIETIHNLENSKQVLTTFKNSDKTTFAEIEKQLPILGEYNNGRGYQYWIEDFIANENFYLDSKLTNKLYKNILLQTFREEWKRERDYKIYQGCIWFVDAKPRLEEFEKNKIALFTQSIFNYYTVGYFSFPNNIEHIIFTESSKNFEFEMTVKTLGRNPKTVTKRYKTILQKGQELKPFDYEEIE